MITRNADRGIEQTSLEHVYDSRGRGSRGASKVQTARAAATISIARAGMSPVSTPCVWVSGSSTSPLGNGSTTTSPMATTASTSARILRPRRLRVDLSSMRSTVSAVCTDTARELPVRMGSAEAFASPDRRLTHIHQGQRSPLTGRRSAWRWDSPPIQIRRKSDVRDRHVSVGTHSDGALPWPMAVRRFVWRACYEALAKRVPTPDWAFMNYGYAPAAVDVDTPPLRSSDEHDRLCIQLYRHAIDHFDLRDKDVLEVGSGRGGGASFISRYLQP
jgi:hypothetical protein